MTGIVYLIKNSENDRKYVGVTTRGLKERWNGHRTRANTSAKPLYSDMRRLGKEKFSVSVLEEVHDRPDRLRKRLDRLEVSYIKKYGTFIECGGYNLTEGGSLRNLSVASRKILGNRIREKLSDPAIRKKYREVQLRLNRDRPEKGRIHSERIGGKNHPRLDKNVYTFKHAISGEEFIGLKIDFYQKYKLSQAKVCLLVHGKRMKHRGWILVKTP